MLLHALAFPWTMAFVAATVPWFCLPDLMSGRSLGSGKKAAPRVDILFPLTIEVIMTRASFYFFLEPSAEFTGAGARQAALLLLVVWPCGECKDP
jgi:hypothetical protein